MKLTTLTVLALAIGALAHAESTVTLTGVHNCCGKCDTGIVNAVKKVDGASAKTDKGTVTITAKDDATAKAAVASLLDAGYAGKGAEGTVTDAKVKSATVSGVHLCCGKCVTAADKAVKSVAGVSKAEITKGAATFTVEGDFSTKDLLAALNKAGMNGSIK